MTLNLRHQIFAKQYALTGNAAQSARLAGYAPHSAKVSGCRLLTKDNAIHVAIQTYRDELAIEFEVTKERVIGGLLDAIDLARLQGNASAMVSAWRELAQICGLYQQAQKVRPDVSAMTHRVNDELAMLSDAELLSCKTACKTFQGPGEKSVEKFPPQVVQCPVFCRRILECYQWTLLPKSDGVI